MPEAIPDKDPVAVNVQAADDLDAVTIGPVSMELRRGQVTVIVGRSGSGKTSMLSVILGISEPTRGKSSARSPPTAVHPRHRHSQISKASRPMSI